jgi:hypothetical protein
VGGGTNVPPKILKFHLKYIKLLICPPKILFLSSLKFFLYILTPYIVSPTHFLPSTMPGCQPFYFLQTISVSFFFFSFFFFFFFSFFTLLTSEKESTAISFSSFPMCGIPSPNASLSIDIFFTSSPLLGSFLGFIWKSLANTHGRLNEWTH